MASARNEAFPSLGDGCVITPEGKPENMDGPNFYIRDGIGIVPKNASLPAGTWI